MSWEGTRRRLTRSLGLAVAMLLAATAGCRRRSPPLDPAAADQAPHAERDLICLEYPDGCVFCAGREGEATPIPPEQTRPLLCDPDEPDACVEFCSAVTAQCALPWSRVPACVFESPEAFQRARFARDTADRPQVVSTVRIVDEEGRRIDGATVRVWVSYAGQLTPLLVERTGKDGVVRLRLPKGPWEYAFRYSAPGRAAQLQSNVSGERLEGKGNGSAPRVHTLEAEAPVRGVVVDASSGEPLPGAKIEAVRSLRDPIVAASAVTDDDGAFVVRDLEARAYFLRVTKFGWRTHFSSSPVTAPAARLSFKLPQVSAIEGVVRDENGDSVSNATVLAVVSNAPSAPGAPSAPVSWTTDADGRFAVDRLFEPGTYYLWARHREMLTYPPEKIELSAGQHADVALRLLHRGARVAGEVTFEKGGPASDRAQVELQARSPLAFPRKAVAEVRGKGFVITGLLPGRYAVAVTEAGRPLLIVRGPKEIEVPIDPGAAQTLPEPLVVRARGAD